VKLSVVRLKSGDANVIYSWPGDLLELHDGRGHFGIEPEGVTSQRSFALPTTAASRAGARRDGLGHRGATRIDASRRRPATASGYHVDVERQTRTIRLPDRVRVSTAVASPPRTHRCGVAPREPNPSRRAPARRRRQFVAEQTIVGWLRPLARYRK